MKFNLKTLVCLFISSTFLFSSCSNNDNDKINLSTEKQILEFRIGEVVGEIVESEKEVNILMPHGTDVTKLVTTVKVSEGASVTPISGAEVDFSNVDVYSVVAEDGSRQDYKINLTVAKSSEARIVSFKTKDLIYNDFVFVDADIDEENKKVTIKRHYLYDEKQVSTKVETIGELANHAKDEVINLAEPVIYTVKAEDGTEVSYKVTLVKEKFDVKIDELITKSTLIAMGESISLTGNYARQEIAKNNKIVLIDSRNKEYELRMSNDIWNLQISGKVPEDMPEGEYTLRLHSYDNYVDFAKKITIVRPYKVQNYIESAKLGYHNAPEELVVISGFASSVIVKGYNLKQNTDVEIRPIGSTSYVHNVPLRVIDENTAKFEMPIDFFGEIGDFEFRFSGDNGPNGLISTINHYPFKVVANPYELPLLDDLDGPIVYKMGQAITLSGSNLADNSKTGVTVRISIRNGEAQEMLEYEVEGASTNNSVTFSIPKFQKVGTPTLFSCAVYINGHLIYLKHNDVYLE